jgi:hypothetical protein
MGVWEIEHDKRKTERRTCVDLLPVFFFGVFSFSNKMSFA